MNPNDKVIFVALLRGMAELHNKKLSAALLKIYWAALKKFELSVLQEALNAHVINPDGGQFMPKPADVVRHIAGDNSVQAMQAWSKVTQAIQYIGSYSSVVFDDPLIHSVINDMGGWIALCSTSEHELVFREKIFEKRYCGYLLRKPVNYLRQLPGIFEHQNSRNGFTNEPPVLWGDLEKAKLVYCSGSESAQLPLHRFPSLETLLPSIDDLTNRNSEKQSISNNQQHQENSYASHD